MLSSGCPEHISDEEFLVRFVWTKSWFNAVGVKPAAFMPQVETRETSVFRHGIDPRDALMAIARENAPVGRNLHGAAFFQAGAVRQAELDVFPHEPPPRHAVIRGWPWPEDEEARKAAQKDFAVELASASIPLRVSTEGVFLE